MKSTLGVAVIPSLLYEDSRCILVCSMLSQARNDSALVAVDSQSSTSATDEPSVCTQRALVNLAFVHRLCRIRRPRDTSAQ
jgi:hypothetical protein